MGKETKEVQVVDQELFAMGENESSGFEGTDSQTFKTPFLKVLQQLSPEMKQKGPDYIEGAILGDFCNSATKEIYKELNIIVLKIEHSLLVWQPNRGGFVGRHAKSEEDKIVVRRDGLKKWDADGNDVVDTIEFFCMNVDNYSDIFIFPLSGASMKYGKEFATRLRLLTSNGKPVGVTWAGIWNIKTVEEKNDKGEWFTIGSTPDFVSFINLDQKTGYISPAKKMLETAETDYKVMESESVDEEPVDY